MMASKSLFSPWGYLCFCDGHGSPPHRPVWLPFAHFGPQHSPYLRAPVAGTTFFFLLWQRVGTTVRGLRSLSRPECIPSLSTPPSTGMNTIPIAFHSFLHLFKDLYHQLPFRT
ncbi:hypothetical protein L873DRAFT_767078 [Choiromyces venosus 120613-1]|uniref:Uncharacterized protein n=1 Tax=Choiromyces venosus 120613-1 TaxID=1336337 RepID=A0A3N4IT09_9PEZI|nr:hypothetical protein L873DRAFT_767078 [Choiromyces venosus 120613-1]